MIGAMQATANEAWKGLLIRWSYKFNIVVETAMIAFIFIGISFFMGDGELDPVQLAPALVGYVIWFYALIAISNMSWGLREETQTGTLEQLYLSPYPVWLLLLGRTLATLILSTFEVLLAAIPMVLLLRLEIPLRWEALPIGLLTLAGLYGFGFVIGGAVLIFKQVEALANLAQNLLLFLNGSLLPVDRLPPWLEAFALTLPSTRGIIVLREVLFEDASLAQLWADGQLPSLLINTALYLVGGIAIYLLCERRARRRGLLGQY
jgi:ABC-2 type transport system permease protein